MSKKRKEGTALQTRDLVYLSTQNLSMSKGRGQKLIPKYIRPMKVLKGNGAKDTYTLDVSGELYKKCIHPTSHIGLLRRYEKNDDELFP
jgi:hypothetical protein